MPWAGTLHTRPCHCRPRPTWPWKAQPFSLLSLIPVRCLYSSEWLRICPPPLCFHFSPYQRSLMQVVNNILFLWRKHFWRNMLKLEMFSNHFCFISTAMTWTAVEISFVSFWWPVSQTMAFTQMLRRKVEGRGILCGMCCPVVGRSRSVSSVVGNAWRSE